MTARDGGVPGSTSSVPASGGARQAAPASVAPAHVLAVDDTPANLKLMVDVLGVQGYRVSAASDGERALAIVESDPPDLVLLDIMMPGLSGYDVCRQLRARPESALLPVVLCTSLDPKDERLRGIEAGADDFLAKPLNLQELLARVRSLLRIKRLQDQVRAQAEQLAAWNATLEARVREQVGQLDRLSRLKRFLSPPLADAILASGGDALLDPHRREITVVFLDLRGFTAFTDGAEPEEVMALLREYHAAMGAVVMASEGTIERFAGDAIMVFFNDPVPIERPAERATRMALAMQAAFAPIAAAWERRGHALGLGCGVAQGYATLGAIGFEGRWDYAAIGNVTNLAARLCAEAAGGEVLVCRRTWASIESVAQAESVGLLALKGFAQTVPAWRVTAIAG